MTEDQNPSSERVKVAKERVPGREATDQRQDQVLDLDIRAIAMLVIAKVVEDVEVTKAVVVVEVMSAAAEEAVVDEEGEITSQVEMRTPRRQHRPLKTPRWHQHQGLGLQPPRVLHLDRSVRQCYLLTLAHKMIKIPFRNDTG